MTIEISLGKSGLKAIVDDVDKGICEQFRWNALKNRSGTIYARRMNLVDGKRCTMLLHHQILGIFGAKIIVDHVDGNGLNNTRENLRFATRQQNNMNRKISKNNTTGFKGVIFDKRENKYYAVCRLDGRRRKRGAFATASEAHGAYKLLAAAMHGAFARYE